MASGDDTRMVFPTELNVESIVALYFDCNQNFENSYVF